MNKILVIGGSGFLGRNLTEALLARGFEVLNLDITPAPQQHERLEFIEGSFTDSQLLGRVLPGCDVVFHLASTTLPKSSLDNPLFDINSNLIGTVTLIDLALKARVKKFIFISSGGTVYGVPKKVPVSETHTTNPTCSYGIVKLAIEKYLLMYHRLYGLGTCSLRLSNPYGKYQRVDGAQGAVTVFCHKALVGETIQIWGDGTIVRDFIYVDDAVGAMIGALGADCAGQVINIGDGVGASLNQVLNRIEAVIGHKVDREYLPARPFDVPKIVLDIRFAKQVLGWQPEVLLADGISKLIFTMKKRAQKQSMRAE